MRIHVIACRVFTRELCYYAATSKNTIDVTFLPQGLHDTPVILNKMLQEAVDGVAEQYRKKQLKYLPDAIALCYGLCSNGLVGLRAGNIPIVAPKTDDCIALFLGSQKRYIDVFNRHSGTYWFNNGWIETAFVPTDENLAARRAEYAVDYGEDNVDFLMEQLCYWQKNYSHAGYISSPVYNDPNHRELTKRAAAQNNWDYFELEGDGRMIQALLDGAWNETDFLICPPGHLIEATFESDKIRAVKSAAPTIDA